MKKVILNDNIVEVTSVKDIVNLITNTLVDGIIITKVDGVFYKLINITQKCNELATLNLPYTWVNLNTTKITQICFSTPTEAIKHKLAGSHPVYYFNNFNEFCEKRLTI